MADKNTEKELKEMRDEIKEVIYDSGYEDVSRMWYLSKDGVYFAGPFGAQYKRNHGLILWNKSTRHTGERFTVSELMRIERHLDNKFDELINSGRLK